MSQPLTHARIGHDSITARAAAITASDALTGYPALAAANALTYSFWSAGLPATWEVDLDEAETCDYFAIAAHTLYTNHAMAVLQAWLNGAWQTLPVLTTIGDLWRFDVDFYGARGAAPGATIGALRRGVAADGWAIKPFYDAGAGDYLGEQSSKFGSHALAVEPAVENLFPENVRNGGDTDEDLTDFDGGSDASYSTDHSVSGEGSILVTAGGGVAALQTDPVAIDPSTDYTFSCKVACPVEITQLLLALYGDVSGLLGFVQFDDVPAGTWCELETTETTGAGDSTVYATVTIDDDACYVDELQIEEGTVAHTWVDGDRGAGDLTYQPEILQQIAGDCTVNLWARAPGAANQVFLAARESAGAANNLWIWCPVASNGVRAYTTDDDSGGNSLDAAFAWGGAWHMITLVLRPGVSGEPNKLIYIDGRLATSIETTNLPDLAQVTSLDVGHVAGASRMTEDGQTLLDDLMVVNRALTAVEIKALYDSGERADLATLGLPSHADDRPIMTLVEETRSNKFRVRIVGQSTPVVGVIYIGKALEMARPLYGGHTPLALSRTTVIRPHVSERGQFLGRSIIRSGASGSWSWSNLTAAWVRRYLDPFIESARTDPFFILWRPASFPGEVGYCWTLGDLSATNSGPRDLMSFTLSAQGIGHE